MLTQLSDLGSYQLNEYSMVKLDLLYPSKPS